MKIEGICALVTGGADGIGKGVCDKLLSKGAKLIALVDYNKENGEKTLKEFRDRFGAERVVFILCDVTVNADLEKAFEQAFSIHKRLDLVLNNAGTLSRNVMIDVNLNAIIKGSYLAKKYMSKQNGGNGGVLINTASIAGFVPIVCPIYVASKFGVVGFSLALTVMDKSFQANDIRVGVICPCFVDTALVRAAEPDQVKHVPNYITVSDVVEAFILAIEDDTKHGCCFRISKGKGVDIAPVKSVEEYDKELQITHGLA